MTLSKEHAAFDYNQAGLIFPSILLTPPLSTPTNTYPTFLGQRDISSFYQKTTTDWARLIGRVQSSLEYYALKVIVNEIIMNIYI